MTPQQTLENWQEADRTRTFPREFLVAAARAGLIGITADEALGGAAWMQGHPVVGALSPSRASDFLQCPLLYRFRSIDRLPERPSVEHRRTSTSRGC